MDIRNNIGEVVFRIPEDWEPIFGDRDLLAGADLRGAERLSVLDLGNATSVGATWGGQPASR